MAFGLMLEKRNAFHLSSDLLLYFNTVTTAGVERN